MEFKKTELSSGVRIVTESTPHIKSFALGFWFNAGSRDENDLSNGIAHFTEHMLFKGTRKRSAKRIAVEIESRGGYLNAFTSKEHTCYYARGLSEKLPFVFEVLTDMILHSEFKESEIEKEARVILDELLDIEDAPEEKIFDNFEEFLFRGDNLQFPVIGKAENIAKFKRKDFQEFIKNNYAPQSLVISASGAVKHEEIIALTKRHLNEFLKNISKERICRARRRTGLKEYKKDIQQYHEIIGCLTKGYKDEKRSVINLLSAILGDGSGSRLFQNIREKKGIAYQLNSFLNSYYDVSSFGVYFSTSEKNALKAEELIFKEFKKLRDRLITSSELSRAKEYLKGNYVISLESATSRMMRIASNEIYYGRQKTTEELFNKLDKITPMDIADAANELFNEKYLNRISIKPSNSI